MRDLYGDDYESVAVGADAPLIPGNMQKMAGAAVFLGLVAVLGLWSYRLGTQDAAEVPVIRAMEGPARVEPEDPGGIRAAHQGLEVNGVLAGKPTQVAEAKIEAAKPVLAGEDTAQGELVLSAPAAMAARLVAESGDLQMPPADGDAVALGGGDALALPGDDEGLDGDEAIAGAEAVAGPRPMNRPANLVVARAKPAAAVTEPAVVEAAVVKAAAKVAAPAAAKAPVEQEVAGLQRGTRLVQLGAFDSEAITRKAWDQLVARNPDLLASKSLYIERTTANARVFYRLRVAGFTNTDQTREMCEALRGRGIDCIPVTLQ